LTPSHGKRESLREMYKIIFRKRSKGKTTRIIKRDKVSLSYVEALERAEAEAAKRNWEVVLVEELLP